MKDEIFYPGRLCYICKHGTCMIYIFRWREINDGHKRTTHYKSTSLYSLVSTRLGDTHAVGDRYVIDVGWTLYQN